MSSVQKIVYKNPFRCRMWELHDRLEDNITAESCRAEIQSFEKHGQIVPALGRRLYGTPDHDVELIYGARRLFVARQLAKPLAIELRQMTDQEAIIAMDVENRLRADISPYERGLSYRKWLDEGYFASQEDISRRLKISPSQVSRLLRVSSLPHLVVEAFGKPALIRETWGVKLATILDDSEKLKSVLHRARALSSISPRPSAREVYRELMAAGAPKTPTSPPLTDDVIADGTGATLFRIRQRPNTISVILPLERMSGHTLDVVQTAVSEVLQSDGEDSLDCTTTLG